MSQQAHAKPWIKGSLRTSSKSSRPSRQRPPQTPRALSRAAAPKNEARHACYELCALWRRVFLWRSGGRSGEARFMRLGGGVITCAPFNYSSSYGVCRRTWLPPKLLPTGTRSVARGEEAVERAHSHRLAALWPAWLRARVVRHQTARRPARRRLAGSRPSRPARLAVGSSPGW